MKSIQQKNFEKYSSKYLELYYQLTKEEKLNFDYRINKNSYQLASVLSNIFLFLALFPIKIIYWSCGLIFASLIFILNKLFCLIMYINLKSSSFLENNCFVFNFYFWEFKIKTYYLKKILKQGK